MTFGERLSYVRKRRQLSQADIGKLVGINGDAYGRYERNEVKPTIEMAVKISDALKISLDYLTGKTDVELDDLIVRKIQAVAKMDEKDQEHVYSLLDAFIAKARLKEFI